MDIGEFGKGKGKQSKGKHGKGKGKGKQGQQGQHGQDRDKSKDKNKDSVECWYCGKRGHYSKDCWFKKNTKGGSKGKHKPKNADAHNLDSKPSIAEPEVEIDQFSMTYLNVDAHQESEKVRGSEWIKIGVDTGAGKTAWPQSITYGTMIPGDSDLTFRTATGELVKGGKRMQIVGCDDWGSNLRIRGVQAPVCKPLLSVGEYTTKGGVTVLKELRDSQYRGCTVAYKENNVYNIYVKPRENKIDAMPLSGDSESGGVAGWVRTCKTGASRSSRRSTGSRSSRRST